MNEDAWFHRRVRLEHQELTKVLQEDTTLSQTAIDRARATLEVFEASRESLKRLDDAAARMESRIPADRRDFFRGHLRMQLGLHRHSNEMAGAHARAILALADGKKDQALAEMKASLDAAEAAIAAMRLGEYVKWRDWYRGDLLLSYPVTRDILRTIIALMKGETPPLVRDFKGWPHIYLYQEQFEGNFPFLYPNTSQER